MANIKEINNALDEVKENLLFNNYKDAMMLMAQITIELIEHLIDDNLIVSKGYENDLRTLRTNNIINQNTEHNFETLIISGVQAHNGVEIPKEHAEKAFEVLQLEMENLFANNKLPSDAEEGAIKAKFNAQNENQNRGRVFEYNEDNDNQNSNDNAPAFYPGDEANENDFRKKEKMRQSLINQEKKKNKKVNKNGVLSLIIIIFIIIILITLIRSCMSNFSTRTEVGTTTETINNENDQETESEDIETTEEETTSEAGYYIVNGEAVNIRSQANTNSSIVARVTTGDRVQVINFYDNEWATIRYNGRDVFINREFIERDTQVVPAARYTEE